MTDPLLVFGLAIGAMLVLILLHVPIGFAMVAVGVGGYVLFTGFKPAFSTFVSETVSNLQNPSLAVIPLFLLMGSFATQGGLSAEIYRFANAFFGHRRGGLATATVAGCGLFGAVCGSSTATAATFGQVALPEMLKRGYAPHFAAGTIAAGGTLGSIVPPSVIMIIYAVIAQRPGVQILDLFVAAIVPSAIAIAFHFTAIQIYLLRRPEHGPPGARANGRERLAATRGARAVLVLFGVITFGIYGGVVTVDEAAALGAVLSFLFALLRRRLSWARFWAALQETAAATAMIYIIIFGASVFTYLVNVALIPDALNKWVGGLGWPPLAVIFVLLAIYLVLGSIFDTISAMVITLPFVLPIVEKLGYDLIWWGIVNVVIVELGMITPPIGMNVFVLAGIARDIPMGQIFRGVMPFVYADAVRLVVLVLFPWLTLGAIRDIGALFG
jgi:tripartite ATP-independent transporter DctM subunit